MVRCKQDECRLPCGSRRSGSDYQGGECEGEAHGRHSFGSSIVKPCISTSSAKRMSSGVMTRTVAGVQWWVLDEVEPHGLDAVDVTPPLVFGQLVAEARQDVGEIRFGSDESTSSVEHRLARHRHDS